MENKFKKYYCIIDCYYRDKSKINFYDDDSETKNEYFFKNFQPINVCMIIQYLEFIIKDMYNKFNSTERIIKEIEDLKALIKTDKTINEEFLKYEWRGANLIDLLKGDYKYLKKVFIIEDKYVPDISYYINNYRYPSTDISYDFSLKELYFIFIDRGIDIILDNDYSKKKN